jgi:hypothetical protein
MSSRCAIRSSARANSDWILLGSACNYFQRMGHATPADSVVQIEFFFCLETLVQIEYSRDHRKGGLHWL